MPPDFSHHRRYNRWRFHLSFCERRRCVRYPRGDGHPIKLAWTAGNWGNAFLALDRNHNGKIDSGKELFGNLTAQPASSPSRSNVKSCIVKTLTVNGLKSILCENFR